MARICISVINDLVSDQRVHRIASALQEKGFDVLLIGRVLPHSQSLEGRSYSTHRMKLGFHQGKLFYLMFTWRLFWILLRKKADILVANDLDTLLANYCVSKLTGADLVYDTHEYFTEVPELINRPATRSVWLRLERWLFPKLKKAYTVNGSIAKIYQEAYGVDVKVIRNLPFRRETPPVLQKEDILIYQGALNVGRGIELMIEAMEHLPGFRLWICGGGDLEEELRQRAAATSWKDRVIFHGRIPFEQLFEFTAQAKLGFSLEEDLGANYHFASPNKVYDYIQAGVPVLVSDLPEMKHTVVSNGVGEVLTFAERKPEALALRVKNILNDSSRYLQYREHCLEAAAELNWEKEKEKLFEIYEKGLH